MGRKSRPRWRVVGACEVAGVAPGGLIAELPEGTNVQALIEAGHIEPVGEEVSDGDLRSD